MKIRYFAWVRERAGRDEEEITPPAHVVTARDLMDWLAARDENGQAAFEVPDVIRVAYDQEHVPHDTPIAGVREVAFFPPMTGG